MKQVRIFELPIYSMKEDIFNNRWKNYFENNFSNVSKEIMESIKDIYFPMNVWKYNQIVGYITISISKNDIWFDLYSSLNKKFQYKSKTKQFIQDTNLLGWHFRVEDDDNNDFIKNNIIKWLNNLIKEKQFKNRYIDLSVFNQQVQFINIRDAIDNLN